MRHTLDCYKESPRLKSPAIALFAIALLSAGALFLGVQNGQQWLQTAAVAFMIGGSGITVGFFKNRAARRTRSDAKDSIESQEDTQTRASSFNDGLVLLAAGTLFVVIVPGVPAWVFGAFALSVLVLSYWIRRAFIRRDAV